MNYDQLLNRAYLLCVHTKNYSILHDLVYMTESEIMGVINFLTLLLEG